MSTLAIIPAAGSGTRMGSGTPKQFLALEGVPIFIHTLRKFIGSDAVDDVLLALRPEEMARAQAEIDRENFLRPPRITPGGSTRQETVGLALEQAPPGTEIVVVHDAVRPFVEPEMIRRIVDAARKDGAAIFAIPTVDTVKQVEREFITGTIPRERIALAQTPQAFRYDLIREAFEKARAEGFHGTDESSLIEHLGEKVAVLMGSDRNIKITKPSDLPLARLYIVQERERLPQPDTIGTPHPA
ncbi:MAG TPA: 2-C-methyl-D-erythritol 4-phosphate cytidylyltransferase [Terriglobia bacterium]|nr:2-C-methyl-D-erythritol 4-phosphate cytidylyltransferase [Terriglobia bacterium]